jgi:hypothetical protein
MAISRTITGIVCVILGLILTFTIIGAIYGVPLIIIGLFIFFNQKEDEIEKIKSSGGKK